MIKVNFYKSTNPKKKLMATFSLNGEIIKTTHFGASGYSDFTQHLDPYRKNRYIARHIKNIDFSKPMSAGVLALYILWNKPTLEASIKDYKKTFNFS